MQGHKISSYLQYSGHLLNSIRAGDDSAAKAEKPMGRQLILGKIQRK